MKTLRFAFSCGFCFVFSFCNSQNAELDALTKRINSGRADTNQVNALVERSELLKQSGDFERGKKDADEALEISKKLNYLWGESDAYNALGNYYLAKGDNPAALKNLFSALKIKREINEQDGIALENSTIGNIYMFMGDFDNAIKYQEEALKIRLHNGNKGPIATSYYNIGNIYMNKGSYVEAMKNYSIALDMRQKNQDTAGIAYCYDCIGMVFDGKKRYDSAAIYHLRAYELEKKINDKADWVIALENLGFSYLGMKNYSQSRKYFNEALSTAQVLGSLEDCMEASDGLSKLDSAVSDFKSQWEHYRLFVTYHDSIFNRENTRKAVEAQMQYDFDKKEAEQKAVQEKKNAIADEAKRKKDITLKFVAGGLIIVIVFSFFLFNRFRLTQKQKIIIETQKFLVEEKQKEVLDSIRYAKRIQQSLFPTEKYIERKLDRLKNRV